MSTIPQQKAASPRRFTLMDSMILTAAVALAILPPTRDYLIAIPTKYRAWADWIGHIARQQTIPSLVGVNVGLLLTKDVLNFGAGLLVNPLVGLTLAVLWMRLRRPRPPWRGLARQPGFVACAMAPAGFFLYLEANLLGARITPELAIGVAILMAWMLLFVGQQWTAERSWIDRFGRVAGVAWLILALCMMVERTI